MAADLPHRRHPPAIFLLGSAQAGAFYAVQSLMQMAEALGPSTLPTVAIQDWPDTPIRGAEIEVGPGPAEDWWHLVAKTMARMKLNLLGPDSIAIPFGFDAESKQVLMPDAKAVAGIKGLQSYFADRYIDIGKIAMLYRFCLAHFVFHTFGIKTNLVILQ